MSRLLLNTGLNLCILFTAMAAGMGFALGSNFMTFFYLAMWVISMLIKEGYRIINEGIGHG